MTPFSSREGRHDASKQPSRAMGTRVRGANGPEQPAPLTAVSVGLPTNFINAFHTSMAGFMSASDVGMN